MKDIKTFLIGFLTCACLFLIMGQTMGDEQLEQMKNMAKQMKDAGLMPEPVGRYQISISTQQNKGVFETILDTKTGEIFNRKRVKFNQYSKID